MSVSVVIPVLNERDSIPVLLQEIKAVSGDFPLQEVVVVDDGSTDDTVAVVEKVRAEWPAVRLVRHKKRRGQSAGLRTGIAAAQADIVVTLDGDGQNDPKDIPLVYKTYEQNAVKSPRILVAGQREKRHDNLVRRLSSRGANAIRSAILGDGVRDTGCSLKLFRRDDFIALPFFDHIHRFIPAMMKASGVGIVLVDVSHRPRERGVSKYGFWDRLWVGIADLAGTRWLISRMQPMEEVENELV